MSALIGVRSSCDMLARNSDLSRFARSTSCDCHCSRAFCSARSAVASRMRCSSSLFSCLSASYSRSFSTCFVRSCSTETIAIGSPRSFFTLPDTTSTGSSSPARGCTSDMRSRRESSSSSANSEMNDVNLVSLPRTDASSRRLRRLGVADLKELLGLIVHQDDVRPLVGDENRIGDVLEDEVQAIALAAHGDFGLSHALHLSFELVRGAAQVGDVAEHREHGVLRSDAFAERMREHLEQQIVALVRIDEVELARTGLVSAGHRRLGQERREQQVVQLERAAPAR